MASGLHQLNDSSNAAFIEGLRQALPAPALDTTASRESDPQIMDDITTATHTTGLMVLAQRQLETLVEQLETIAGHAQGETFDAVIAAMDDIVGLLARIALRVASEG